LLKEDKNAVFLVSYQIPGTPGYELLTKSTFIIEGEAKKVKAKVERFDFSSHCGKSELHDFVRSLKGNPIIFVVHGTEENSNLLTDFIREDVGLDAVIPGIGAVYKV
jgi:putative mRNA 3-end processing factor